MRSRGKARIDGVVKKLQDALMHIEAGYPYYDIPRSIRRAILLIRDLQKSLNEKEKP
jgi:hypothetical protein